MPINVQFEYQIIPAFVTCLQCSYPDTISWAFTNGRGREIYLLFFLWQGWVYSTVQKFKDFSTFCAQQLHTLLAGMF